MAGALLSKNTQENEVSSVSSSNLPPLIDIDCNLLHKDLVQLSIYGVAGISSTAENDNCTNNKAKVQNNIFDILCHPSTKEANIRAVFSPSSSILESQRSLQALSTYASNNFNCKDAFVVDVKTSVGVHPYHSQEDGTPDDVKLATLQTLIEQGLQSKVVSSVGECGLDYSPSFPAKEYQIPWFKAQLELAYKYSLPLFIHERLAFQDTTKCIDDARKQHPDQNEPRIVIHCFTGTREECQGYISRGYFIGITGYILKDGDGPVEVTSILSEGVIPLDKLMIETDAPYMGFPNCRDLYLKYEPEALVGLIGKARKRIVKSISPNVPSSLPMVLKAVVNALNKGRQERDEELLSEEHVGTLCTRNAIDFFGFRPVIED